MTNAETQASVTRFYEAFARRDGEAMAARLGVPPKP
jgi:hypothetical protein